MGKLDNRNDIDIKDIREKYASGMNEEHIKILYKLSPNMWETIKANYIKPSDTRKRDKNRTLMETPAGENVRV